MSTAGCSLFTKLEYVFFFPAWYIYSEEFSILHWSPGARVLECFPILAHHHAMAYSSLVQVIYVSFSRRMHVLFELESMEYVELCCIIWLEVHSWIRVDILLKSCFQG